MNELLFYAMIGLYGVALYNCFRVIGSRISPAGAIAWILFQLTLPVVGVPLYLLLGEYRIQGYVKRHRARTRELTAAGMVGLPLAAPEPTDVPENSRATFAAFRNVFGKFGEIYAPRHGSAELLVDGTSTFEAIFAAIERARSYIFVQYYIVRSDRMGLELKRLLIKKANEGIPIHVLFDDMGSFWLSSEYTRDLVRNGIKVARFLPIANFKRFFQMNFRNHRKLVVVDGVEAFTGGLNVGEEYAAGRSRKSAFRYWRDTHLRICGAAVISLEDIFVEDWYFATGEKLEPPMPAPGCEPPVPDRPAVKAVLQTIPSGPTDDALISVLLVMQLINAATQRIWIATPYFVPDPAILRSLELAALRGVDVKIILPRVSDNRLVDWVSLAYAEQLQARGVQVLLYEERFMHQKVILTDESVAAVGTMNLDNRAMYLNFETMVLAHGGDLCQQVRRMLENDFLACRYLQPERSKILKYLKKLRGNAARLLAPLL